MNIIFKPNSGTFHLQTENTSYVMQLFREKYLFHSYWGKRINKNSDLDWCLRFADRAFSPALEGETDRSVSLGTQQMEYPSYGSGDFRSPAFEVEWQNGTRIVEPVYQSHSVINGKPPIAGLPSTYCENDEDAMTLIIYMQDLVSKMDVELRYSVYKNSDALARSVIFRNNGDTSIRINRALSFNVDIEKKELELLQLSGMWAKERQIFTTPIRPGMQSVESRRGMSSHMHNPFVALAEPHANESSGEVYGFSLVYSGNFIMAVEKDQFDTIRVQGGINPFDFSWLLSPHETFSTPEAIMVYSPNGFEKMTATYHRLYRHNLCRGEWRSKERPILINNWEATYFNFDEEKIADLAKEAAGLGIELLVLDDGWFGKRDNDLSSLGDWEVNYKKLPSGLNGLAERVKDTGIKFGLWVEPVMISPDSNLYREHPDWCIHVPNYRRSLSRCQAVLDFCRPEVCDYIVEKMTEIFSSADIQYVKWDCNRHLSEIGSVFLPKERQKETAHRFMLGVYQVMEILTTRFPHILFESCSGGGGRFDPGMLYYMPQAWCSDDTDAVERLRIQHGSSLVYPICSSGAHVSAVPNHQVQRVTSLKTRGDIAFFGAFGYELDLKSLTDEEKCEVKRQVSFYKNIRKLVQFGDFYRLKNPFNGNVAAWMSVSPDKCTGYVMVAQLLCIPQQPFERLLLRGLSEEKSYKVTEFAGEKSKEQVLRGDVLMNVGLNLPCARQDFSTTSWLLEEEI